MNENPTVQIGCLIFLFILLVFSGCNKNPSKKETAEDSHSTSIKESASKTDPENTPNPFKMTECAESAGVRFTYRNGSEAKEGTILESLGGGVAMFDFDRDGSLDLIYPGGGSMEDQTFKGLPHALFRNLGNFQFDNATEDAGIVHSNLYSHAPAIGDFDGDGFEDLLITGFGGTQLFKNQGDGTFEKYQNQIPDRQWSSSAAWGDLNGDQLPDLYLCHYVNWSWENHPPCTEKGSSEKEICSPRAFEPLDDSIFFNQGDGTFIQAGKDVGLSDKKGKGLGVILCDIDNDLDLDIYVANDTTENFLYINDGKGKFSEIGRMVGVAVDGDGVPNGSMGLDILDYNLDGQLDLFVANYEAEAFALYKNVDTTGPMFSYDSHTSGITALGALFVGFGTSCTDLDLDGDEDVIVANGHVLYFPGTSTTRRQKPLFIINQNKRFKRMLFNESSYFGQDHEGRGLASGDLDNDGDVDFSISHVNDPVAILKNEIDVSQSDWIAVNLIGTSSERFGKGATVALNTSAGTFIRQSKCGGSYMSSSDPRLFWGVPQSVELIDLTIKWPSGIEQKISQPAKNEHHTVVERQTTHE